MTSDRPNQPRLTVERAVGRGVLTVNGPVRALLIMPALTAFAVGTVMNGRQAAWTWASIAFAMSWPIAWLTWSILTPRWRLWAYQRVDDLQTLKQRAVDQGLIWPEGWIFEKTEIASSTLRKQLRELEDRRRADVDNLSEK